MTVREVAAALVGAAILIAVFVWSEIDLSGGIDTFAPLGPAPF